MARIAIFGGSGYAGSAIAAEAIRRGHAVVAVVRSAGATAPAGVTVRQGDIHDDATVQDVVDDADVVVVSIPYAESDGLRLQDAFGSLTAAAARTHTRLGFVGGAASLYVGEDGPRLLDTPEFPEQFKPEAGAAADALAALSEDTSGVDWFFVSPAPTFGAYAPGEATGSYRTGKDVVIDGGEEISGADFALAFVDEIDNPKHRNERFAVAH